MTSDATPPDFAELEERIMEGMRTDLEYVLVGVVAVTVFSVYRRMGVYPNG